MGYDSYPTLTPLEAHFKAGFNSRTGSVNEIVFRIRYLLSPPSGSLLFVLSVQMRILPYTLEVVATK